MSSRSRPPALMKALRARSTRAAASAGSGLTSSAPVSMRATSSSAPTRSFMWSAWSSMMRKNWRITPGSRSVADPSAVAAEPLMDVRGARSSWLTVARNSARSRSCSASGVRSCSVTTKEVSSPSSE